MPERSMYSTRRHVIREDIKETAPDVAPPDRLRITTFGEFAVIAPHIAPHGTPHWGRDDSRLLLKCLLSAPMYRGTREHLMALLWPDRAVSAAQASLRHALSRLRHVLDPASTVRASSRYIGSDRETIWLQYQPRAVTLKGNGQQSESAIWIDRQEFEEEAQAALTAFAHAHDLYTFDEARKRGMRALRLYRGAFLPNDLYADWTWQARSRCQLLWANCVRRLSALMLLHDQNYDQVILLLTELVEAMPDDENAVSLLMLAQAVGAHRSDALHTYSVLRQRLRERFDMIPTGALETLAHRIRAGIERHELLALFATEVSSSGKS